MSSFYGNIVVNLNEGNTSLSSLQLDDNGNFYGLNEDSQRIAGPFNAVSTGANIIATLTYKNYDGSQTIATRNFINGIPQSEAPINPFRNATAQYEYSFAGWADNTNQTSGQLSINSLWHDKIVYAAYTATQRTYTVTWKDSNGTVLETDSNVPYGTYPSYDGSTPNYNGQIFKEWSPSISNAITGNTQFVATYYNTYNVYFYNGQTLLDTVTVIEGQNATYSGTTPTKTGVNDPENYTFSGWDPLPNNIQANTTCYAQFTYSVITDTWEEIFANTANGTYKTKYNIGDIKELNLGTQGVINMQIIAFDTDDLADGSGKAPITWLSKQLLNTSHRMNPGNTTTGGWAASQMRSYYQNTIKPLIPSNVRSAIQSVTKYTRYVDTSNDNVSSSEDIWIPSSYEIFGSGSIRESQGVTYTSFFIDNTSRVKMKLNTSTGSYWWLRTAYNNSYFADVRVSGSSDAFKASSSNGCCALGFCTGGIAPSQSSVDENGNILDSWDTIISNIDNGTYSTKYSIGNTKQLDLGTQGTVNMQIVAFDADELADGSGTAPITWISKELLNTNHRINPNLITNYSYPDSPSWTGNSSNVWMTQTAYCSNSTAEATWTVTAIEAGTLSIGYKTSSANTSNNKLTVEVNGTAIATNHARTSYVTHTVECAAGDTVTVHAIYQLLIQDNQIGSMKFESTGGINITASVEDGPKRVRDSYQTGTGSIGGWEQSEMRTYLRETVKPLIPSIVRSAVVEVTKYSRSYNTAGTLVNDVTTTDDVWIPSYREMSGNGETQGPAYSSAFPDAASRVKYKTSAASASVWWLRSAYTSNSNSFNSVSTSGSYNHSYADNSWGIALGFCLGGTSTQTTDITDGAYGVEWDYSNSSPALTRKGLAADFTDPSPATSLTGSGFSPFDNIQPWAGMKRYNIIDGAVAYSEDDAGFSETDYDTVVYIPEFYYFAHKDTENSKWTWAISPTAKEGYSKHPGSGRYVGRYHTSGSSEGVYSKSGVAPLVNTNRTNFRTYSHDKGTKWWMIDLATWSALQMLYLVEFANFYSQDTLGTGYAGVTSAVAECGATGAAVYHTLKLSAAHNQYRWVEDPFSNCRDWVDGFIASSKAAYIGTDNATFADSASALTATGITLPSSNYISGFGYSEECPWAFIPDTALGGETTYVTDYVSSSTGTNALCVGGSYSTSAYYGFFFFSADFSASFTYGGLGSRLLYIP